MDTMNTRFFVLEQIASSWLSLRILNEGTLKKRIGSQYLGGGGG
jgi:hypothetical protein